MKLVKFLGLSLSLYLITGCVVHVNGQSKQANVQLNETLNIDATGIERLIIDSGAGSLTVNGDPTANDIQVFAKIRTTEERDYQLTLDTSGREATLIAKSNTSGFWFGPSSAIDLEVILPARLALDIDDGSGDSFIRNIENTVVIDDGSGDLSVINIKGNVTIDDGSGDLSVKTIYGDVKVEDASGDVSISDVSGQVMLEDGSGSAVIEHVRGKVTVEDGSGDLTVRDADSLTVLESGSGGLHVDAIKGNVTIAQD